MRMAAPFLAVVVGLCAVSPASAQPAGLPRVAVEMETGPLWVTRNDVRIPPAGGTEFSLLDGACRVDELLDEAARLKMPALAVTEHGNMFSSVVFHDHARARGLNPILGCEVYVAPGDRRTKSGVPGETQNHLVLLAETLEGYHNLIKLVSSGYTEGFYYKPRIDREHLARHSAGLVGLSACLGGEIPRALETDDWESARRLAGQYGDIFGAGRFFLELQDHGLPEQRRLNEQLLRLAPEVNLPLVVTNDLHYVHQSQAEAHDVLLCVGTGNNLDTPNRMKFETNDFWLKPAAEMERLFPEQREALLNTKRIAEMVDLSLPLGQLRIPHFPVPAGETVETWLRKE